MCVNNTADSSCLHPPCLLQEDDRTGTGALQMSLGGRHNQQEVPSWQ